MNEIPSRPARASFDKLTNTPAGLEETNASPVPPPGAEASIESPGTLGDYLVVMKIGEGGMGAVYLAEDPRLGRRVAIKTLRPELAATPTHRERFLREARAAAAVESDFIVPIWSVGEAADGTPFIAMPLLQGEPLDSCLNREPVASHAVILKVAREVSEALVAAHEKGLIHRDIKPGNIWLEGDPDAKEPHQQIRRCKVLDFGLARSIDTPDSQITSSGAILGTPAYMAPEQAKGEHTDHRADLFSLGVTLYRMATGRLPFNGTNAMAVLIALSTEEPVPVRELAPRLPPAVAELIERLMCKAPCGRPQSAAEVCAQVREFEREQPLVSHTHSERHSPWEADVTPKQAPELALGTSRSARVGWQIAAVGSLLVLAFVALWLAGAFSEKPSRSAVQKEDPPQRPEPSLPSPPQSKPPKGVDADRKAAEWVLSAGGMVHVIGQATDIKNVGELPKGDLDLSAVYLTAPVKDAQLSVFQGCRKLTILSLVGTQIDGQGLAYFQDSKGLEELYLAGTRVDDAAVPVLKQFTKLADLAVGQTKISEKGVMELAKALPKCRIQHDGGTIEPKK